MPVRKFEELESWQRARELTVTIHRLSMAGPWQRDFGLRDQIQRASVSAMSNIAEGFERYGRAEFRHHVSIARGSVAEVRSQLTVARDLGYVDRADFEHARTLALRLSRLLAALYTSLSSTPQARI